MLVPVRTAYQEQQLLALCRQDALFGSTILTHFHSHRKQPSLFQVWLGCNGQGEACFGLCVYGSQYTLCAPYGLGDDSMEELRRFFRQEQQLWLQGDEHLLKDLFPHLPVEGQIAMTALHPSAENNPCINICDDYPALAAFLSREIPLNTERWLSRNVPLMEDGQLLPFCYMENGQILCCAFLSLPKDVPYALACNLLTLPSQRGKGLGKTMMRQLCACAKAQGRQPYLVCAEDSLAALYATLGFSPLPQRSGFVSGNPNP